MERLQEIKIKGYTNRWCAIDQRSYGGKIYYLMENSTYGDETCYLVITEDQLFIEETFDDITTCLKDLEVI